MKCMNDMSYLLLFFVCFFFFIVCFFFQAEDGIRDLVRSRGLGDVYKRQEKKLSVGFLSVLKMIRFVLMKLLRSLHKKVFECQEEDIRFHSMSWPSMDHFE